MSYSHAADGQLAPALQSGLQRLAKSWYRLRALHVFRDETGLATKPHLWSSIQDALDDSAWLVLLASPEAAASEWVDREVLRWLETKSLDHVLTVVTDGEWRWDANLGRLTGDAVPAGLREAVRDEPRHLDLRWARSETDLDLRNTRFRGAVADLAATIHGVPKDELESEDVRQHRRARRLARGGFATIAILLVLALLAGGVALVQRGRADRKAAAARREANAADAARLTSDAARLAAEARSVPASQVDLALLLAVQGRHLSESDATDGALFDVLAHSPPGLNQIVQLGTSATCAVPVSIDGRFAAASTNDGVVHLVDVRTGRSRTLANLAGSAGCATMTFSADGNRLVTAGRAGKVVVWDTATARPIGVPLPIESGTWKVYARETRPGRIVSTTAGGGDDATSGGTIIVWDTSDPAHPNRVARFSVTAPNDFFPLVELADLTNPNRIAVSNEVSTRVWDLATHTLVYPPLPGRAVGESPDGSTIITSTAAQYLFWDAATGQPSGAALAGITPFGGLPSGVWYSPDGTRLAVQTAPARAVKVVDLRTRRLLLSIAMTAPVEFDGPILRDGRLSLFGGQSMSLWRTGMASPTPFATGLGPPTGPADAFFTPNGSRVLATTSDGLEAWDPMTGATVGAAPGGPYNASTVPAYSSDGTLIAFRAGDGAVPVLDVASRRVVAVIPVHGRGVDLTWSPRAHILATVTTNGEVTLWNLAGPARAVPLARTTAPDIQRQPVPRAMFSPDGQTLAVWGTIDIGTIEGRSGAISLFDVPSGHLRHVLRAAHGGFFGLAAFSPDSRALATTAPDKATASGQLVVGDTATGKPRARLALPYSPWGVSYVAGGRWLAVAESHYRNDFSTGRLELRDAATLVPVGEPIAVPGDATTLYTDPSNTHLLVSGTTSAHGGPIVWDLDPSHWETTACHIAGRNLTRFRMDAIPSRPPLREHLPPMARAEVTAAKCAAFHILQSAELPHGARRKTRRSEHIVSQ